MDKESNADGVWPRKEGWQSITNKEGSTASGALLTEKGSSARGSMPGGQCRWKHCEQKGSNAWGEMPGEHCYKKGCNARGAMLGEHC